MIIKEIPTVVRMDTVGIFLWCVLRRSFLTGLDNAESIL